MARKTQTVADFPPEFLAAWNLAAENKLLLALDSVGEARNMIQRLYTFRKRLMEEAPEIAARFYLVDLRVHDELGNVITSRDTRVPQKAIIRTYNPTWKDQIRKQVSEGGVVPAIQIGPTVELMEPSTPLVPVETPDSMTETLSDLGYSTDK